MPGWYGYVTHGTWNTDFDAHPYRTSNKHWLQDGTILLIRACGHDAFFDYHERHMVLEIGGIDSWISQGSPPFYAQVDGVPMVDAKFDVNFDIKMRTRHFPFFDHGALGDVRLAMHSKGWPNSQGCGSLN